MNALWTSTDAAQATLGNATHAFSVNGLSIDTRTLKPGDLFVALKGDNRDGHDFIGAAFNAKAGAALVAREPEGADGPLLLVANTQRRTRRPRARGAGPAAMRSSSPSTGSAGKTTTKEILRLALGALGTTHASAASYNNHWGVPLSPRIPAARCALRGAGNRDESFRRDSRAGGNGAPACGTGTDDRAGTSGILRHHARPSPTRNRKSSKD